MRDPRRVCARGTYFERLNTYLNICRQRGIFPDVDLNIRLSRAYHRSLRRKRAGNWQWLHTASPLALLPGISRFRVSIMIDMRAFACSAFFAALIRSSNLFRSILNAYPRPP